MRRLSKRSADTTRDASEPRATCPLRRRIRGDLRRRGVPLELAGTIAERIAPRAEGLDAVRYAVLLDGAAAAAGDAAPSGETRPPAEFQRLVQDFAVELKKLDEGLRLLSSYLLRIREGAGPSEPRTLH